MNKIISYLRRPYPLNNKPWQVALVAAFIIFFLFFLFQPFNLPDYNKWLVITTISLITALSILFVGYIFPLLFKKFYSPDNWTVGKNLISSIIILFVIGTNNFIFDFCLIERTPHTYLRTFLSYQLITFLIGIIPATVITFITLNQNLKRNLQDTKILNRELLLKLENRISGPDTDIEKITLTGSTKDSIELNPEDILYIESSGNYLKINYLSNNTVKQKQLRATISKIESDIEPYSYILRCHRAFLVNTLQVKNIEGNALGFQLMLNHVKEEIPVSRSYTKEFKERLKNI